MVTVPSTLRAASLLPQSHLPFLQPNPQTNNLYILDIPKTVRVKHQKLFNIRYLCAQNNTLKQAVDTLIQKQNQQDETPDKGLFATVLKACAENKNLQQGRRLHSHIIKLGIDTDLFIGNCLLNVYANTHMVYAERLLNEIPNPNNVSWNTLISGHARKRGGGGHVSRGGVQAFRLFKRMHGSGTLPDKHTLSNIFKVCGELGESLQGMQVHALMLKLGGGSGFREFVTSSLVDMYAKCSQLGDSYMVFNEMGDKDLVSWTTMITAFAQSGKHDDAIRVFMDMLQEGVVPDAYPMCSVVSACWGSLVQGKQIHAIVLKLGLETHNPVGNSLMNMYRKCGDIKSLEQVFEEMPARDVISWSTLIAGCASHGQGKKGLEAFRSMRRVGIRPNNVTFVGALGCCAREGLVNEGRRVFEMMKRFHDPIAELYAFFVDVLGRTGLLDEAERFIDKMPVKPCASVWKMLVRACRIHKNLEIGIRAAKNLLAIAPDDASSYNELSDMYALAGRWNDVEKVRMNMEAGVQTETEISWIEIRDRVHVFRTGDNSHHPQSVAIYQKLDQLTKQMKAYDGYDKKFLTHDREVVIGYHQSEMLTIALGLISLPPDAPIRIVKNSRMRHDCHCAIKIISKIVGRNITVKDPSEFHHFHNGFCSCRDYW